MIERLKPKQSLDFLEFVSRASDIHNDFYITINKVRTFFQDLRLIKKVVETQEVYALWEKELKGILIIYREKGFRPYIKILASSVKMQSDLVKYLIWNFSNKDLYIKLKKQNSLVKTLQRYGFIFAGDRGIEILLFRKGDKELRKIGDKDDNNSN